MRRREFLAAVPAVMVAARMMPTEPTPLGHIYGERIERTQPFGSGELWFTRTKTYFARINKGTATFGDVQRVYVSHA